MALAERSNIGRELERMHLASFGWALACCGWNRDEAQDTLQSAYLKVIDGRARFQGRSSLKTWFFGVVKKTAAERRRYGVVRDLWTLGWWQRRPDAAPEPTPELQVHKTEVCQELQRHLERLSPRQRDLMHLVFYQELTIEQASRVLGIPIGTARTHYERGKQRLKKMLAGAGETKWTSATIATDG